MAARRYAPPARAAGPQALPHALRGAQQAGLLTRIELGQFLERHGVEASTHGMGRLRRCSRSSPRPAKHPLQQKVAPGGAEPPGASPTTPLTLSRRGGRLEAGPEMDIFKMVHI